MNVATALERLRLDVAQVWDLAGARARFGRYLTVAVNGMPLPF